MQRAVLIRNRICVLDSTASSRKALPRTSHSSIALAELAKRKGATTAQLSLAWLLAQKPFVVPIPGTGKVKHLEENIEAANLVLTAEDLKEIDLALSEFEVHGGRMNEQQMKVVGAVGLIRRVMLEEDVQFRVTCRPDPKMKSG